MKKFLPILFLCLMALPSCAVEAEIRADALRYKAIAEPHRIYVQNDPNLTPIQKQDRLDLLTAWKNSFPEGYLK